MPDYTQFGFPMVEPAGLLRYCDSCREGFTTGGGTEAIALDPSMVLCTKCVGKLLTLALSEPRLSGLLFACLKTSFASGGLLESARPELEERIRPYASHLGEKFGKQLAAYAIGAAVDGLLGEPERKPEEADTD